ncbi:MAG: pyridoxamine 5'-phosphate oxidase family protein [Clostridiales bacterium]|nr:pyridoxamine 5'-phosphate oxidase family protein [Clostridiales bacterium]
MKITDSPEAIANMNERFGKDSLIAIATVNGDKPEVRAVNSYYEDGAFYVITHALSGKIRQLALNPAVAICGEWFTAHGIGENIGHPNDPANAAIMDKLRKVFASWYSNGHVDESDPNTCILKISLTDGLLFYYGERFDLEF